MYKFLKVTPKLEIEEILVGGFTTQIPLSLMQDAVDGPIEVLPINRNLLPGELRDSLFMIVNEEGLIKELDPNPLGCHFYGTVKNGWPIVGNLLIVKEDAEGGEDLKAFGDGEELARVKFYLKDLIEQLKTGELKWHRGRI